MVDTVELDALQNELQLDGTLAVLSAMQAYNQSLAGQDQQMSARWLASVKKDGVKLRNMKTQQWLAGFKAFVKAGHVDRDRGVLTRDFAETFAGTSTDYTPPDTSSGASVGIDSLPTDMREYAGFLLDAAAQNEGLRTERSSLRGHYRLIRASTREKSNVYFEEPMFIGDVDEPSWICLATRKQPRTGFSFAGLGVGFAVFASVHSPRLISGAMVTLHGFDFVRRKFLSGVMSRLSDERSRPAAVQVLAIREDDEAVIQSWQDAVQTQAAHSLCATITAENDPEKFAMLEDFQLRHNVKGHLLDDWYDLMDKHGGLGDGGPVDD